MINIISILTILFINILYKELFDVNLKNTFQIIIITVFWVILSNLLIEVTWQKFILTTIVQVIIISYILKRDLLLVLPQLLICKTIIFIAEGIFFLKNKTNKENIIDSILFTIIFTLVIIISKKIISKKNIQINKVVSEYSIIGSATINVLVIMIVIRVFSRININYEIILIESFIVIALMIILNRYYYKGIAKAKSDMERAEINYRYNNIIDELIEDIRGNEHEYKNHINTITSMIYLSNNIEEAKIEVNSYIKHSRLEIDFNKILLIENTVIRAIIYSKSLECKEKNIEFIFNIKGDIKELNIESHDLTVILTNILNNAIESTEELPKKEIYLEIDMGERKNITIKNNIINIKKIEKNSFMKRGFSKKGQDRGYGLYNVKKVVKKYCGEVTIIVEDDWILVNIKI